MKKFKNFCKKIVGAPLLSLLAAIIVIMCASLLAAVVNSSGFTVKITEVSFDVEEERGIANGAVGNAQNMAATGDYNRKLVANLYMPRGAGKDSPRPLIVATHGYNNNKELQEIAAIELSKRGFIVLSIDQYQHGDSTIDAGAPSYGSLSSRDAVYVMYKQDYVLKDANGNAMIGVTGHSAGAGASGNAMIGDEQEYGRMVAAKNAKAALDTAIAGGVAVEIAAAQAVYDEALAAAKLDNANFDINAPAYRKIAAILYVGAGNTSPVEQIGPRTAGVVAGQFDQFFFTSPVTIPGYGGLTWKYYVETAAGMTFLGNPTDSNGDPIKPVAGEWYKTSVTSHGETYDNVSRIIWCPYETHPHNHWSLATGAETIEFFQVAFEEQLASHGLASLQDNDVKPTSGTGQTWWLKEAFTLIALIGLACAIVPAFRSLASLPFLSNALYVPKKKEEDEEVPVDESSPDADKECECEKVNEAVVVEKNNQEIIKQLAPVKWIFTAITLMISYWYLDGFFRRLEPMLNNWMTLVGNIMTLVGIVIILLFVATMIVRVKSPEVGHKMTKTLIKAVIAGLSMLLVAIFFKWAFEYVQISDTATAPRFWNLINKPWINKDGPATQTAFWAASSGGMMFLFSFGLAPILSIGQDVDNMYGLKATWKNFLASLAIAVILLVGIFFLIALVYWIFGTDFRFYTYAIQIFNKVSFAQAWTYMPIFFIFYLGAGVSVYTNTRGIKSGWKADLMACLLMAGPAIFWLLYQYIGWALFGRSPSSAGMTAIWTGAIVPTLLIAAVVTRRMTSRTGNVWLPAIFNTVFFTFVCVTTTIITPQDPAFWQHTGDSAAYNFWLILAPILIAAIVVTLVVVKIRGNKKNEQACECPHEEPVVEEVPNEQEVAVEQPQK